MRARSFLAPTVIVVALLIGLFLSRGVVLLALALFGMVHFGRRASKVVGCVLYFGVLGPLVGFVAFWIMIADEASLTAVLGAVVSTVGLWFLAVPIGAPPAVLTGFIYYAVRRRAVSANERFLSIGIVAALGATASALWAGLFEGELSVLSEFGHWSTFAVPGGVAAVCCAFIAERCVLSSKGSVGAMSA